MRAPAKKKPLLDDAVLCYELPTALRTSLTTDTQGLLSLVDFNASTSCERGYPQEYLLQVVLSSLAW